jgi:hypothetical protein
MILVPLLVPKTVMVDRFLVVAPSVKHTNFLECEDYEQFTFSELARQPVLWIFGNWGDRAQ